MKLKALVTTLCAWTRTTRSRSKVSHFSPKKSTRPLKPSNRASFVVASEITPPRAHLSAQTVQKLTDCNYEQRRAAAFEIEKIIENDMSKHNGAPAIFSMIAYLNSAFIEKKPWNVRLGGLMGLAVASIALGPIGLPVFLNKILPPILSCFSDSDARVQYYAFEALFNVAKVARVHILPSLQSIIQTVKDRPVVSDPSIHVVLKHVQYLLQDIVDETRITRRSILTPIMEAEEPLPTPKPTLDCDTDIVSY